MIDCFQTTSWPYPENDTDRSKVCEPGFTLIELSIVLVIIGLIVGGVLIGQDLIRAAGVRATISQIEKYNTAANAFLEKYGFLPGDIPDPQASKFGLQARGTNFGTNGGQGDGNGLIQGQSSGSVCSNCLGGGEGPAFWVDLTSAHLIDGGFTSMIWNGPPAANQYTISLYFPQAKLGRGNYIYAWSGGLKLGASTPSGDGRNYFGLSAISRVYAPTITSTPALSVQQAYSIDAKIDDGFPQSGNVQAYYYDANHNSFGATWAAGSGTGASGTAATPGSSTTCYDNANTASAQQTYSVEISSGANINCALTFKMQAGD